MTTAVANSFLPDQPVQLSSLHVGDLFRKETESLELCLVTERVAEDRSSGGTAYVSDRALFDTHWVYWDSGDPVVFYAGRGKLSIVPE